MATIRCLMSRMCVSELEESSRLVMHPILDGVPDQCALTSDAVWESTNCHVLESS